MKRWAFLIYGITCHLLFFATFAYLLGFVGNVLVPKTIDSFPSGPIATSLVIDVLLIAAFGLQHSVMARPAFKRVWTRIVPQPIERTTYVLASCFVTVLMIWQWRAIDVVVWDVQSTAARAVLWGIFASGWLLVPAVSLMIDHFDLFGTRQVWLHLRGREYKSLPFRTPMLYSRIRHPLYVGWAIAFWAAPTMTVGHFLFATALTIYMAVAVWFEERDLVEHFGHEYTEYQKRVPMVIPRLSRSTVSAIDLSGPTPVAEPAVIPAFPSTNHAGIARTAAVLANDSDEKHAQAIHRD
jgi:protein-S-isoprenylcysteine O-methyltransferase Ste14